MVSPCSAMRRPMASVPWFQVSITSEPAAAIASAYQPPWKTLRRFDARNARSMARKMPIRPQTRNGFHFQVLSATSAKSIEVMTMTATTAMPYASASEVEERNRNTVARQPTIMLQLRNGM